MGYADAFRNQAVLVTGASSGLGAEFARQLAARGSNLGLVARRGDKLNALADELSSSGARIAVAVADVGDRPRLLESVEQLRSQLGIETFDRAILNAGAGITFRADKFDAALVEEVTRVNFLGAANTIQSVLPSMIAAGRGHIIGISSLSARRGLPMGFAYGASKAALTTMLDGMRVELASKGVDVTVIHPGFVRTPMIAEQKTPQMGIMDPPEAIERMLRAIAARQMQLNFPLTTSFLTETLRRMPVNMSHYLLKWFVLPTIERAEGDRTE